MKRNSKSQLPPPVIRTIFGANVANLRDRKFHYLPNVTQRNLALAALLKPTSKSQIERIVKGKLGTSIDLIDRLATALDVRPQDLLTPYFTRISSQTEAAWDRNTGSEEWETVLSAGGRKKSGD